MRYICLGLAVLAVLLMLFINRSLADMAEWLYPGSAVWVHLGLAALEIVAVIWLWKGLFGRRRHLLLMECSTPEERRLYHEELARRMRANPHILKAGITPEKGTDSTDPVYLARCMEELGRMADAEINQTAKRVFLATALSQNGRLDALIVLLSLCRLVWRVSGIYNQQPHPREIAALYWAVVSSTFLALSFEELDLSTEISVGFGEALHAMLPAGLTASLPLAGKALQTFTASAIDGAANCYLALRTGIIARNAYAYGARPEERPSRAAVFREAGSRLLSMSGTLLDRVGGVIAAGMIGAARKAGDKTVQAGKGLVEGIGKVGQGLGSSVGKIASGGVAAGDKTLRAGKDLTRQAGKDLVEGIGKMGHDLGASVGKAASGTAEVCVSTGSALGSAVGKVASGTAEACVNTGSALGSAVGKTADTTWNLVSRPFKRKKRQGE